MKKLWWKIGVWCGWVPDITMPKTRKELVHELRVAVDATVDEANILVEKIEAELPVINIGQCNQVTLAEITPGARQVHRVRADSPIRQQRALHDLDEPHAPARGNPSSVLAKLPTRAP